LSTFSNKLGSFFDKNFKTPHFILKKEKQQQLSRRGLLKSAAGIAAITALPSFHIVAKEVEELAKLSKIDPWLTLNATLNHLLPKSENNSEGTATKMADAKDISAQGIDALAYLYQIMTVQPTAQDEKDFILKGVGWLNGYANSEKGKNFVELNVNDKELLLRGISNSRAGGNWLNTLIGYIYQAMLAPPSYGGNTNGSGWQWLEHQAGFPLPEKGQRYFELPPRAKASTNETIAINTIEVNHASLKRSRKA